MKVPLSWLREFVDVDLPVDELVDVMGGNGLEVDGVAYPGAGAEGIVVGEVVSWEPHPDADKLRVVQVTHGGDDTIEVVCGASNFDVGDRVAHAVPGASIPGMKLEKRKLRGVVSNGMLCSAKELQIGEDHGGIMLLPSDWALGSQLTDHLPLGEPVIDVEVLADRGDHHSILGIARELAAILDLELRLPDVATTDRTGPVDVRLDEGDGCSQFATWTVGGVEVGPSPWTVRMRLAQCGVRAISNVVDVTNYVMLELGQPMHAYDLDTLDGPLLGVRLAEAGERLTTLDDKDRELDPRDLVVVDAEKPVGLAGVMGGAATEVSGSTAKIVFEAATWNPTLVRATSLRLRLHSEASLRFSRGVDPDGAQRACGRAIALLRELGQDVEDLGTNLAGGPELERAAVRVEPSWVRDFIGLPGLDDDRQVTLLERAGCAVSRDGDALLVGAPSWRTDLARPADVAEEVVRLHGYDKVPATLPMTNVRGGLSATQKAEREVRGLALAAGLHEAITRPFVGAERLDGVVPGGEPVVLSNPLAQDASAMRTSMVEGLLQATRRNVGQGRPGVAIFEMGRVFHRAGGALDAALAAFGEGWRWADRDGSPLPTQPRTLGVAVQGRREGRGWLDQDATWSVHDVLALFDEVVLRLGPADDPTWRLERRAVDRPGYHPGRSVSLHLRDAEVGFVGQLHPEEAERRDLPEPVAVGELLLEPLLLDIGAGRPPVPGRTLVRHQAMAIDVALVADDAVPYATLEQAVREGAGDLLDRLWAFDEYRGEQVGEGRRSVAVRLRLQAEDRQLTDEDKAAVIAAITERAERAGATVRS